jgi:hypothetical protein
MSRAERQVTTFYQLARRVARLEPLDVGPVKAAPDVRALDENTRNRLIVLLRAKLAGQANQEAERQMAAIFMYCPWTVGTETILPPYLLGNLQEYWQQQKNAEVSVFLPGGDYNFFSLGFSSRHRLMSLCQMYGWDNNADVVNIAPLNAWADDDLNDLIDILWASSPET